KRLFRILRNRLSILLQARIWIHRAEVRAAQQQTGSRELGIGIDRTLKTCDPGLNIAPLESLTALVLGLLRSFTTACGYVPDGVSHGKGRMFCCRFMLCCGRQDNVLVALIVDGFEKGFVLLKFADWNRTHLGDHPALGN